MKKNQTPKTVASPFRSALFYFIFWLSTIVYLEGLLHIVVYGGFAWNNLYALGFSASFAAILTLVMSFLPKKAGYPVAAVILAVLMVLFGSQIVYMFIFGNLYSVSQMQQGGAAITSFWKDRLSAAAVCSSGRADCDPFPEQKDRWSVQLAVAGRDGCGCGSGLLPHCAGSACRWHRLLYGSLFLLQQ